MKTAYSKLIYTQTSSHPYRCLNNFIVDQIADAVRRDVDGDDKWQSFIIWFRNIIPNHKVRVAIYQKMLPYKPNAFYGYIFDEAHGERAMSVEQMYRQMIDVEKPT